MPLFRTLLNAVLPWRRRRGGPRPHKRSADVALERLDHRQLLTASISQTFGIGRLTGNVEVDFPSTNPNVVILPDNPSVQHPTIQDPLLQPLIKVSGLDINGIRLAYDPDFDALYFGLDQPTSQQAGRPGDVISGDTDNNGNSATVDPAVTAIEPTFLDFADLGGSETMGAFLSFQQDGLPQVVAGIGNEPDGPKTYQVAQALVNPIAPNSTPRFGTQLDGFAGNVYLVNDPNHPNFEFAINSFSALYQAQTGTPITNDTTFQVGAFGNSGDDDGIDEAFFPGQTVRFGDLVPPPPPPPVVCPPVSPPILINPHSGRHINTAHQTLIRVNVFGTSGFDASTIDPATVRLGGATPVSSFTRNINRDPFPDKTLVFRGPDVNLPPGFTSGTVTGQLADGTKFQSSTPIFNRSRELRAEVNSVRIPMRAPASTAAARAPVRVIMGEPDRGMAVPQATARSNPARTAQPAAIRSGSQAARDLAR